MTSIDFLQRCFSIEPEAYYRVQCGTEVRIYQIEAILEDAVIFKTGEQYRLYPLSLVTIEPMTGKEGTSRNPALTLAALVEINA